MPISIKLKQILKERDLSQRELARMTGLRSNTISHLCSDNVDRVYLSTLETNGMQSVRHRHSGVNRGGVVLLL